MSQQNWYGKLFSNEACKESMSAYVGMDDETYKAFLRKKEDRQKAIDDIVREINDFGSKTSYYINENGLFQLVHMAASYQICFYSGDSAVTYVLNTDMPADAFMEKLAFWQSILIGSGISLTVLTQPLMQGQFRNVVWAMEGNLRDALSKLPFEGL